MSQQFSTQWGGRTLTIEVGKFAPQASGSCTVRYGDTVIMGTAVMSENRREGIDYFPLSVDFDEKLYAAGIIKGSRFIKREGRPSDDAILTGRLIDRGIRPLFNDAMRNEVQVVVSTLSYDNTNDHEALCIIAASCALHMSDIPWNGPVAGIRVGQIEGEWVINPTVEAQEKSILDLVITGTTEKVTQIEAEGQQVPEDVFIAAIEFARKHLREPLQLIEEVRAAVGREKRTNVIDAPAVDAVEGDMTDGAILELTRAFVAKHAEEVFYDAPKRSKAERMAAFGKMKELLDAYFTRENIAKDRRKVAFTKLKHIVEEFITEQVIEKGRRVDGRGLREIRSLSAEVGLLPRTHGTGFFQRGETHVLSIVTLGSPGDEQLLQGLEGESKKRYMHHYNFPAFSVGETGPNRGPGRREIGHGALAEKALVPVLPPKEIFPYTIRVVSEVMSSNGSSSMGSTCGSTLALMDAGVPITEPVGGIAMGLASNKSGKYVILTDLQDLEDGPGGMDFKIAGTRTGITAIQMDTKTDGLTADIVRETFAQAREARMEVLDVMARAIAEPRAELSPWAPKIVTFMIPVDKIREVIGPGGKVINEIIDKTGVKIDIEQTGQVSVTATPGAKLDDAVAWIKNIVRVVEAGEIFEDGIVTRVEDYGIFVEVLPKQEGLVHVSELSWQRVESPHELYNVGDRVKVMVKEIDEQNRISLSIKRMTPQPEGYEERPPRAPREEGGGSGGGRSFGRDRGGHGGRGGGHGHGGNGGSRRPRY